MKPIIRLKKIEEEGKKTADQTIKEIVKQCKAIPQVLAIILFGSYARGQHIPGRSDIDILFIIDTKPSKKIEKEIQDTIREITRNTEHSIHSSFRYKKITQDDQSLMLEIAKEGKILYKKDIIVLGTKDVGLDSYTLITFDTSKNSQSTRNKLSKLLHGYKHTYTYKGKKKTKNYPGLIDGNNAQQAGKGALLIRTTHLNTLLHFTDKNNIKTKIQDTYYK